MGNRDLKFGLLLEAAGFFFDALGTRTQDSALWNAAAMSS